MSKQRNVVDHHFTTTQEIEETLLERLWQANSNSKSVVSLSMLISKHLEHAFQSPLSEVMQ